MYFILFLLSRQLALNTAHLSYTLKNLSLADVVISQIFIFYWIVSTSETLLILLVNFIIATLFNILMVSSVGLRTFLKSLISTLLTEDESTSDSIQDYYNDNRSLIGLVSPVLFLIICFVLNFFSFVDNTKQIMWQVEIFAELLRSKTKTQKNVNYLFEKMDRSVLLCSLSESISQPSRRKNYVIQVQKINSDFQKYIPRISSLGSLHGSPNNFLRSPAETLNFRRASTKKEKLFSTKIIAGD